MYNYKTSGFNNFLTRAKPRQVFDNVNLADFMQAGSVPFSSLYLESGQIADKVNASEITSTMLADAAVTTAKLANLAVDNDKLAALAVDAAKLAGSAVTSTKIANLAVGSAAIAALAVGTAHIANGAILNAKIGNLEVTNTKIANLAITNAKINDLDAGKINAGTISADRISTTTLTGKTITAGTCMLGYVGGHSGLSLNGTTDYHNIFFKRDSDGIVFFRLNEGGSNYITYNSSSGVLDIRGSLNADDIIAGTITGRDFKANNGAGLDIWVQNDGYIRFRNGSSTKGYLSALGDNSLRLDADNNIQLHADSVDTYYNDDNDGSNTHWRSHGNDDMKMKLTSGGELQVEDSVVDHAGIDFAELFENKIKKIIPYGTSVILENEKIRPAKKGETPIGIVSSTPGLVCTGGESDTGENWHGKYLKNEWGKKIMEKAEFWRYRKETKGKVIKKNGWSDQKKPPKGAVKKIQEREKINPEWDKNRKYVPRMERLKEWSVVGLIGRIRMLKGQPTAPSWIKLRDISDKVEEWLVK